MMLPETEIGQLARFREKMSPDPHRRPFGAGILPEDEEPIRDRLARLHTAWEAGQLDRPEYHSRLQVLHLEAALHPNPGE